MQYAANLPNTRAMLAPVVALVIGAAGATGVYALVDDNSVSSTPDAIVISEPARTPATTGPKNGAVSRAQAQVQSFGKDESTTAAAIGSQALSPSGPNEAGVATAVSRAQAQVQSSGKDESTTAAAVGSQAPSSSGPDEASTASVIGGAH